MSLAPNLRYLVDEPWTADGGGASTIDARRELRALLAVAKAADEIIGSDPCACGNQRCDNNKISRALSRLARLSSRRGTQPRNVCSQCGGKLTGKHACGPTHALLAAEYRKARGARRAKRRTGR